MNVAAAHSSPPAPGSGLDRHRLTAFATRLFGAADDLQLEVRFLRGGLQAAAVAHVQARYTDGRGRRHTRPFVAKRLDGSQRREAVVYETLLSTAAAPGWPRLLGVEEISPDATYLYLEHVTAERRWPWKEPAVAGLVLEQLAHLHLSLPSERAASVLSDWDYEADLRASSLSTLEAMERCAAGAGAAGLDDVRAALPALRRVVAALPAMRAQLLSTSPFGTAVLHGDAHPGNAIIRRHGASARPVLLDWGRARLASPLEDVGSWLQSLGLWEPEARRRHDTLLRRYLSARGLPRHLGRSLRDACWLASAANVLAGTLRLQVAVTEGWAHPSQRARQSAVRSIRDCLRVARRADAVWRA